MEQVRRASCMALALLVFSVALYGQQESGDATSPSSPLSAPGADVPTLHAGTHMVALDVVVTDKKGHTVPGLTQDNFHIFEDGRPQTGKFFEEACAGRSGADCKAKGGADG